MYETTRVSLAPTAETQVLSGISKAFYRCALISLFLVTIISIVQIYGWALGVYALKHLIPNEPSMPPGAAILFLLSASASYILLSLRHHIWRQLAGQALGLFIFASAFATYLEHVLGLDWSLSQVLWETGDQTPLTFPAPMLPDVSFYFTVIGIALFIFGLKKWIGVKPAQIATLLVYVPNLVILLCYLYGLRNICAYFGCVKVSPLTAISFSSLCFSILFLKPEEGISSLFIKDTTAGKVLRLGLAMVPPLIAIWLIIHSFSSSSKETSDGLYDPDTAALLFIVCTIALGGTYTAWFTRKVDTVETARKQAEADKSQAESAQLKAEQMLDSFVTHQKKQYKYVCLTCEKEYDETVSKCPEDGTALTKMVDNLRAGSIFADRYEIVRVLGAGGMSTVYLAKHLLMNKLMAVKLLHTQLASDVTAVQRFQREAQTVTLLSHPNVLSVHDFGVAPDGAAFLVMDYLDGCSLQELLKAQAHLSWEQASPIFEQICAGLNHAHIKGIVHRDLKPGNIMLIKEDGQDHTVKIVDFGLAKVMNPDESTSLQQQLTRTGEIFGSPLYMSPEQCEGSGIDHRSDIYALGCLMYEAIGGAPPFMGSSIFETLTKQLRDEPREFSSERQVQKAVRDLIWKALEKDPEKRFQSASEMRERIAAVEQSPKSGPSVDQLKSSD